MSTIILYMAFQVFFPIFNSSPGEYLGISLVNTGTRTAKVTVSASSSIGAEGLGGSIALPPGGQHVSLITEIFGQAKRPPRGSLRIDSSEAGVLTYLVSGKDSAVDATVGAWEVSNRILLPHVVVDTTPTVLTHTDTLVMLVNPNRDFVQARAELIGLNGGIVGTTQLVVAGLGSRDVPISEAFKDALSSNGLAERAFQGYLRVSSCSFEFGRGESCNSAIGNGELLAWQRIERSIEQEFVPGELEVRFQPGTPRSTVDHINNDTDILATIIETSLKEPDLYRVEIRNSNLDDAIQNYGQYTEVVSARKIPLTSPIQERSNRRILRGYAAPEILSARTYLAPHVAFGGNEFLESVLNIVNPTDTSVNLDMDLRLGDGATMSGRSIRRTLLPGEALREPVATLFEIVVPPVFPPPLITGYVQIRRSEGTPFQILGDVEVSAKNNDAGMLVPLQTDAARSWVLPFAFDSKEWFTGYAIVNPNAFPTDVTVAVLNSNGRPAGIPKVVSLSAAAKQTGLVEDHVGAGYLQITASLPVIVLGSFGKRDLSILNPIPGLPISSMEQRHFFSFESGMEGWDARGIDLKLGGFEIDWSVTRTSENAFDAATAVRLYLANYNDAGKIWIERPLSVKPNRTYRATLRFAFGSSDCSAPNTFTLIAGVSSRRPENRNALIYRDSTFSGLASPCFKWLEKSYGFTARSSTEGTLYLTIGVWGTWETKRAYLIDAVEVSVAEEEVLQTESAIKECASTGLRGLSDLQ